MVLMGMRGWIIAVRMGPLRLLHTNTSAYAVPMATPIGMGWSHSAPRNARPPSRRERYHRNGRAMARRNAQKPKGGMCSSAGDAVVCMPANNAWTKTSAAWHVAGEGSRYCRAANPAKPPASEAGDAMQARAGGGVVGVPSLSTFSLEAPRRAAEN